MEAKFSPRLKDVITYSREEALRLGQDYLGVEHLFLGILREGEGNAIKILKAIKLDLQEIRKCIETEIKPKSKTFNQSGNIPLVKQAERALKITYLEAKLFKSNLIGTEHLLLSILKDDDNVVTKIFEDFNIDYNTIKNEMDMINEETDPKAEFPGNPPEDDNDTTGGTGSDFNAPKKPTDSKSKTPVLDNFGRDLTDMATEGRLDPVVGREKEIERVSQILSRRKKK